MHGRRKWLLSGVVAIFVISTALLWCYRFGRPFAPPFMRLEPIAFSDLSGWQHGDPLPAAEALRRSCSILAKTPPENLMGGIGYAGRVGQWLPSCAAIPPMNAAPSVLRRYFETWFVPLAIGTEAGANGLFTGYDEPLLAASPQQSARYNVPLYGLPDDLVMANLGAFQNRWSGINITGRAVGHRLVPFPSRAEIDANGLPGAKILAYTDDPVSAFFLEIQGSGRLRFADGTIKRVGFAATNGRPYTAIGRVLLARGALKHSAVSLQSIRAWLNAHPRDAGAVMETNESYVFFYLGPLGDPALGSPGTEGVALTPQASLAIDPRLHPLGAPFYVDTTAPNPDPARRDIVYQRLLIAQDTGGAIRGAVRGDIFWGTGTAAEAIAGRMKSSGRLYVLVPKTVAKLVAPYKDFILKRP